VATALAGCAHRASVQPAAPDAVTFGYEGPADAATLRGTFTGWRAVPLARAGRRFQVTLAVPPGRHEYRLEVRRGGAFEVVFPAEAERVSDDYGGENAVLRVP
jgi:hypothetical protein